MKLTTFTKGWVAALAVTLASIVSTQAALVNVAPGTIETPGVALGLGTAGLTGNVVASRTTNFTSGAGVFSGTLRSMVVDRGAGLLDFYYQVQNTTPGPIGAGSDIFRLAINGFSGVALNGGPVSATFRSDGTVGLAALLGGFSTVGTKGVGSADRDPGISGAGGLGFDFGATHSFFDPNNVDAGQTSFWMVARTNATAFNNNFATVSGADTAFNVSTFTALVPVPEPGSALAGMLALGLCCSGIFTRRRSATVA